MDAGPSRSATRRCPARLRPHSICESFPASDASLSTAVRLPRSLVRARSWLFHPRVTPRSSLPSLNNMMPTLLPQEKSMRVLVIAFVVFILSASSSYAQGDNLYIAGTGGFAAGPDVTSSDTFGEIGVRVAPRLFVFADVGQIHNLQPSTLKPVVDSTTALLTGSGLNVIGTPRE